MAGEADFALYLKEVLHKLVQNGSSGAVLWCFADYAEKLATRVPFVESKHEMFFGLVRSDGSLKPHAQVIADFAAQNPKIRKPEKTIEIDAAAYYAHVAENSRKEIKRFY
jgi:endo-1,4-beta-mannosidase